MLTIIVTLYVLGCLNTTLLLYTATDGFLAEGRVLRRVLAISLWPAFIVLAFGAGLLAYILGK